MQKRESKEFKEFFERFFIPVCHFIKRYTEEEEVADIAQEVFVKVYEKWNEFDSLGNAQGFSVYCSPESLFRILSNIRKPKLIICLSTCMEKKRTILYPKRSYPARDFPYPAYGDRQGCLLRVSRLLC